MGRVSAGNAAIDTVLTRSPTAEAYLDRRAGEAVDIVHWVHTGAASVWIDGDHHRLRASQVVWVAAHQSRAVSLDSDSVMLPIPVVPGLLGTEITPGRIIDVPEPWHKWLLHFVSLGMLPRLATGHPPQVLADLLAEPMGRTLLLPRDQAAADVAQELIRHPSSARTLSEWADWAHASTSRLRRSFAEQTGLTFRQWRTRCRMNAAADHLANGRDIEWTAHHTGYTPNALSRAFRGELGVPPGAFARQRRRSTTDQLDPSPVAQSPAGRATDLGDLGAPLPAASGPAAAHGFYVAYWVVRGTATFQFHDRSVTVMPDEAVWLPPGIRYAMRVHEDSVLLPLGYRVDDPDGSHRQVDVISLGDTAELALLHTTMATHTQIRPRDYDRSGVMRVIEDHLRSREREVTQRDPAIDEALSVLAGMVRRDPANTRGLAQWADFLGIDHARLSEAFGRRFGTTFRAWRAGVRMSVAAELLRDGTPASSVAKRLGYAHLSGFSRLFSDFHGVSPRAYQAAARTDTTH